MSKINSAREGNPSLLGQNLSSRSLGGSRNYHNLRFLVRVKYKYYVRYINSSEDCASVYACVSLILWTFFPLAICIDIKYCHESSQSGPNAADIGR